jgi:hypothetical protein
VKEGLVRAAAQEADESMRRKLAYTMAQVAGTDLAGPWPELLSLMSELMADAGVAGRRELGYGLLERVAEYRIRLLLPFLGNLPGLLARGLEDPEVGVRVAALKAACSVLLETDAEAQRAGFKPLLPSMVAALEGALNMDDEKAARECLMAFNCLIEQVRRGSGLRLSRTGRSVGA